MMASQLVGLHGLRPQLNGLVGSQQPLCNGTQFVDFRGVLKSVKPVVVRWTPAT